MWSSRLLVLWTVIEVIALALWVGGLVVIIGAVIPAVFNAGMETGGRLLTKVFDGYNRLVLGAIVLLISATAWRLWASRQGAVSGSEVGRPEMILLTLMIGIFTVITLWLGPDSVALQEQAFAAKGEAAKKAAYGTFFRSHLIVRGLYVTNLVLGIGLLGVKVKQWIAPFYH